MAERTTIFTKRDGVLSIADSGGAHSYTVAYELGDFSLTIPDAAEALFLDRGRIGTTPSVRLTDDQPMTFSFTAYLRDVAGADYATLLDICHRYSGGYVATNWVSTLTGSDVFCLDLTFVLDNAVVGGADITMELNFCSIHANIQEGDPNSISISGTSYSLKPVVS